MLTSEPMKVPEQAVCRKCGYSLRALTMPRCPECGRLFDPDDPRTWTTLDRRGGRLWWRECVQSWARAPAGWEIVLTICATFFALVATMPLPWRDEDYAKSMLTSAAQIFAAVSVLRLSSCVVVFLIWPQRREPRRMARFLVMPACLAVLLLALGWRETALQRRCIRYQARLAAICRQSLQQPRPLVRGVGKFGVVVVTSQPSGVVAIQADLDYEDPRSVCTVWLKFDPTGTAPQGEIWLARGFSVSGRW